MVKEIKWDLDIRRTSIVKYWAPWCSPCKIVWPIFEDVEKLYTIDFYSVNVDDPDNIQIVEDDEIQSIPTIKIIDWDWEVLDSLHWIISEDELIKRIDEALWKLEE